MGFLDNLLREGTRGVLGHQRGSIEREQRDRNRKIEDDEIKAKADRDALAAMFDLEQIAASKSRRTKARTDARQAAAAE